MTNENAEETTPRRRGKRDAGQAEVTERLQEEQEKGYSGTVPDPTPNYNYTVAGNDEPTPETDEDLKDEVETLRRDIERGRVNG